MLRRDSSGSDVVDARGAQAHRHSRRIERDDRAGACRDEHRRLRSRFELRADRTPRIRSHVRQPDDPRGFGVRGQRCQHAGCEWHADQLGEGAAMIAGPTHSVAGSERYRSATTRSTASTRSTFAAGNLRGNDHALSLRETRGRAIAERYDLADDFVTDRLAGSEGHSSGEVQRVEIAAADHERSHDGLGRPAQLRVGYFTPLERTRCEEYYVTHDRLPAQLTN